MINAILLLLTFITFCQSLPFSKRNVTDTNIRGVNLGGLFVLEKWITPSLFDEAYGTASAVDQWGWMDAISNAPQKKKNLALQAIKDHWSNFITEDDFNEIAQANLNAIRIPVGHWTFDSVSWEPYMGGAELSYLHDTILLAKKYNLSVTLDLHTAPNSQNGYQSSGKAGPVNFARLNATQNVDRLSRALLGIVEQFACNETYGSTVTALTLLNEPLCSALGQNYLINIYRNLYNSTSQSLNSCSSAQVPQILLHDCFAASFDDWTSELSRSSFWKPNTFSLESHQYQAYAPQNELDYNSHIRLVNSHRTDIMKAQSNFPITIGEFSLSIGTKFITSNDSVGSGDRTVLQNNSSGIAAELSRLNTPSQNLFYRRYWEAQMLAFEQASGGWFFWTWKTEESPTWSYSAALKQGWIPRNPTERVFTTNKDGSVSDKLVGEAPTFNTQTSAAVYLEFPRFLYCFTVLVCVIVLSF